MTRRNAYGRTPLVGYSTPKTFIFACSNGDFIKLELGAPVFVHICRRRSRGALHCARPPCSGAGNCRKCVGKSPQIPSRVGAPVSAAAQGGRQRRRAAQRFGRMRRTPHACVIV